MKLEVYFYIENENVSSNISCCQKLFTFYNKVYYSKKPFNRMLINNTCENQYYWKKLPLFIEITRFFNQKFLS